MVKKNDRTGHTEPKMFPIESLYEKGRYKGGEIFQDGDSCKLNGGNEQRRIRTTFRTLPYPTSWREMVS